MPADAVRLRVPFEAEDEGLAANRPAGFEQPYRQIAAYRLGHLLMRGCDVPGLREAAECFEIASGVADGQKIRLRGRGRASPDGGESGDIVVQIAVRPHPVCTSSTISTMSCFRQSFQMRRANSRVAGIVPPSPWTSSRITAAGLGTPLCELLVRLRCSAGLTQADLARRAGLSERGSIRVG